LDNAVLDALLGISATLLGGTVYVGLSTTAPTKGGTGATEPVGGSYARVAVLNDGTNWPAASLGIKVNGAAVTFPTATGDWGLISHYGIWDAASAGDLKAYGALDSARNVLSADDIRFLAGVLRFQVA
jgi:hypothetical protein